MSNFFEDVQMKSLYFLLTLLLSNFLSAQGCSDLFFSEYSEGSSNNKYLEIYNPSSGSISLSGYSIIRFNNGSLVPSSSTGTMTFPASAMIPSGGTYVIANASASATILGSADTTSNITWFNGDDAIVLMKGTDTLDIIGIVGVDPGSSWTVGTGSTVNHTLVRKPTVSAGQTDWTVGATEWNVHPQNTWTYAGTHSANCICQAPNVVSVTNTYQGSITIALDNYPTNWEIYIERPTGINGIPYFSQATGVNYLSQGTGPMTITGLVTNQTYGIFVKSICSNNISSVWSPVTLFTPTSVNCEIFTFPFVENFDSPHCWINYSSQTINPSGYGPSPYFTFNGRLAASKDGGLSPKVAYRDTVLWLSPKIQGLDSLNKRIDFLGYSGAPNVEGKFWLGVTNAAGDISSLRILDSMRLSGFSPQNQQYQASNIHRTVFLDSSLGVLPLDSRLAFIQLNTGPAGGWNIDNLAISRRWGCTNPTGLSLDSINPNAAYISWQGVPDNYEIEYGPKGFAQGTGSRFFVQGTGIRNTSVTGLTRGIEYDFYIKSHCDTSYYGGSEFIGPLSFQYYCLLDTLPYIVSQTYCTGDSLSNTSYADTSGYTLVWYSDSLIETGAFYLDTVMGSDTINLFVSYFDQDSCFSPRKLVQFFPATLDTSIEFLHSCNYLTYDGNTYYQDTVISEQLLNGFGCDSLHVVSINVSPSYNDTLTYSSCDGFIPYANIFVESDTSWIDQLISVDGCDSNIFITSAYRPAKTLSIFFNPTANQVYVNADPQDSITWIIDQVVSGNTDTITVDSTSLIKNIVHNVLGCIGDTSILNLSFYSDTTAVFDTIPVYDTIAVFDTIPIFDTIPVFDTSFVDVFDTIAVFDTIPVFDTIAVFDTIYITQVDSVVLTVTDTLIIDVSLIGINPPTFEYQILVYPNPTNNFLNVEIPQNMIGQQYSLEIVNALGQSMYGNILNQQQLQINLNSFAATGTYTLQIKDSGGTVVNTKVIILQ